MDPLTEIKRLYFNTTRSTIERDVARAIDLLKSMSSERDRDRAAVYMSGLADMRKEWKVMAGGGTRRRPRRMR